MKPLKAAAYCRVSKKEELQRHSLESQQKYYETHINAMGGCSFAGVYADIKSGLSRRGRKQFNAMIQSCKRGRINIIYVKSISRFSRNTVDFLTAIHDLKKAGVDIIFENEQIQASKERDEFRMTTLAAIAQEESVRKSQSIKWALKVGFATGLSGLANRVCYGYTHDDSGNLIPDPEKAPIVKLIFDLYLNGMSLSGISKELHRLSIPSPTGRDTWTPCAIDKLLSNEKYKGNVLLQKTYVPDVLQQCQVKNSGELTQYLYENNHIGIIDEALFDSVQIEKQRRSKHVK